MPDEVGEVEQIVYGEIVGSPNAWLTFSPAGIHLCVNKAEVVCTAVSKSNLEGVQITYDTQSEYPTVIYKAARGKGKTVSTVDLAFRQKVAAALVRLNANTKIPQKPSTSAVLQKESSCFDDGCDQSPQIEDPGDSTVYVTAAWPEVSVIDGAVQFVTVSLSEGSTETPDELPSGVSPSDILNARDPIGMAKCTADAYRTYQILFTGCFSRYRAPTLIKICTDESLQIYRDILKTECYPKYYNR
jgi:hypothetical protein